MSCLSTIQDPRRKEGLRHNLYQMFSMILLSGLCGHFGGRPVARFVKANSTALRQALGLKHPVPSNVTFSHFLNHLPSDELIAVFHQWTSGYLSLEKQQHICADGKALQSTLADRQGKSFESIVTFFSQKSGLAHSIAAYQNEQKSEIEVVYYLLDRLQHKGIVLHLDALHCQKKR